MANKWYLGVIGGFSLLIAGYLVLQSFLFEMTDLLIPMGTLFFALVLGLMLKLVSLGKPAGVYTILSSKYLWGTVVIVGVGVVLIRLAAFFMQLPFLSPIIFTSVVIAVMAAICETWAIAGTQDMSDLYTGIPIIGVVLGAVVACFLHFQVYGTSPVLLIYVFVAFLILNAAYYYSGSRVEVPLLIHLIINLLPFLFMGVF